MTLLLTALPALAGGIVQGMTGFGCGIVIMLFLPMLLSVQQSSAISQCASVFICISMAVTYRKSVNLKLCIKPWVLYFPMYYAFLTIAAGINTNFLKPFLGLFLVALSIYCICFSEKIHIKAGFLSALICAGISAVADSFFGIGGPPMVLYFLATTQSKEEYLGSIQTFFTVSCLLGTILRITKGQITLALLPQLVTVIVMLLVGKTIGSLFVKKIDQAMMKKLVYGFVGISGMVTFLTNLSALGL